jgi:hypothetical protein
MKLTTFKINTAVLLIISLFIITNKAQASEPNKLNALGEDSILTYPYPVNTLKPGKKITLTAEYTGTRDVTNMDWHGSVCGKTVSFPKAGRKITLKNVTMPKVGEACRISLYGTFSYYDYILPMATIYHTVYFVDPTITTGVNPSYFGDAKYFVRSSVQPGHTFSYWRWYINGCDKASTGHPDNRSVSQLNHKANGKDCNVEMNALAKYDDTSSTMYNNNKFVVYNTRFTYNPLDLN